MGDPAFDSLLKDLTELKTTGRRKAERAALKAAGKLLQTAIKRRVPSQAGEFSRGALKPGELAASYEVKVKIVSDQDILSGKKSRVNVSPQPASFMAGLAAAVEYGHENKRGKKRKGSNQTLHGRTPAHPFVRPAWDETQEAASELFQEVATAAVQKEMSK